MGPDDIIKIIEKLPEYIKLIYPGYITIYLYYFFRALTVKDNKTVVLKATMLSYIFNIIADQVCTLFFIKGNLNYEFAENMVLIFISFSVAYICFLLTKSKRLISLMEKMKIYTTFSTNEIEEIENQSDNGAWLVVYMKENSIVYEGYLINKEMEPDKKQYIILSKYRKYIIGKNGKPQEPYIDDYSNNEREKAVIFYDKIATIEVRDTIISDEIEESA